MCLPARRLGHFALSGLGLKGKYGAGSGGEPRGPKGRGGGGRDVRTPAAPARPDPRARRRPSPEKDAPRPALGGGGTTAEGRRASSLGRWCRRARVGRPEGTTETTQKTTPFGSRARGLGAEGPDWRDPRGAGARGRRARSVERARRRPGSGQAHRAPG